MAAPTKQGLDYFPYAIGLLKDRKFRSVRMKYGAIACLVYLAILELAYGDKGYYIEYEANRDDVLWEITEYLRGRFQPDAETVSDVIDGLVESGLFSGDHYPKIITSKRLQATYYKATTDRKAVTVDFGVWLLSEEEMREIGVNSVILRDFINRANNGVNRAINSVNRAINPQSKVKKSKVKERKGDSARERAGHPEIQIPSLQDVKAFCASRKSSVDPERFYAYNDARGWVLGGDPIRDWRAVVIAWERLDKQQAEKPQPGNSMVIHTHEYTPEQLNAMVDDIDDLQF